MTSPPSNFSADSAKEQQQCIVNDQMGPFTVLYILIFISSLPGNMLSVWAFIRSPRAKGLSVYLVNLLAADLMLTLALPFKILKDLGVAPWGLMVFHCQASAVTMYISLYASISFIDFIIIHCYLQDCTSQRLLPLQDFGFARLLSVVIWLLLLLIMVPNMALPIQQVQVQQFLSCSALKKGISMHWHALSIFLCTALFLNASVATLISTILSLKRLLGKCNVPGHAMKMQRGIAALAVAYMISFVPYHVVRTPYTLAQTKVITDCQTKRQLFLAKESTFLLATLHLCFDPLIYFYFYSPFRQTVSKVLWCCKSQTINDLEEPTTTAQKEVLV
ncbi:G-protein coupled receptor 171 isoform X2 [Genypterus blacodes]|uniref:G-protein coupled receptor 171 isoform X2 n=1 Tax=Genypterus blacodes TaxID=154954 RepID=UPI003F758919